MRNVPVTVSVPSSVTPWSMNPVHSSLAPLFVPLGHFHPMSNPRSRDSSYFERRPQRSQRDRATGLSNEAPERTGSTSEVRELSHQTIVEPHELGIVIILEHQLPGTYFRFLMEQHLRA